MFIPLRQRLFALVRSQIPWVTKSPQKSANLKRALRAQCGPKIAEVIGAYLQRLTGSSNLHPFVQLAILAFMTEVTRILSAIEQGDPQAASQLLPLVYDELRRLAAQQLASEKPGQTLNATALVHEAYLRLAGRPNEQEFANRRHFYAAAAEAMRRILVDNVRRKRRLKHGGGHHRQPLDANSIPAPDSPEDLLELSEALDGRPPKTRSRRNW